MTLPEGARMTVQELTAVIGMPDGDKPITEVQFARALNAAAQHAIDWQLKQKVLCPFCDGKKTRHTTKGNLPCSSCDGAGRIMLRSLVEREKGK